MDIESEVMGESLHGFCSLLWDFCDWYDVCGAAHVIHSAPPILSLSCEYAQRLEIRVTIVLW